MTQWKPDIGLDAYTCPHTMLSRPMCLRVPVLHLKRLKLELWRDESSSPFLRAEVRRITADVMVYDDASGSLDLQVTLMLGRGLFWCRCGDHVVHGVADIGGAMLVEATYANVAVILSK